MILVATAGHIDHGKTSLVRALTGVETDRLPEEKARGISIDLGFAYWPVGEGRTIGFVDVPGHERFVRNMLAGVSAVHFALLVVAADDGVMPQTLEHLEILDLLGIGQGVAVITKVDKAAPERIAQVERQLRELIAGTGLAGAEVLPVSTVTGEGIERLAKMLRKHATTAAPSAHARRRQFRLAVDRAFSVTGSGSVVTGTIIDGEVHSGSHLVLAPSGRQVRVRAMQVAGNAVDAARAGQRCAINLAGIELAALHRGDWLCAPGTGRPTSRIAVHIRVLKSQHGALAHNRRVHVHLGTASVTGRLLLKGQSEIAPGGEAPGHLLLDGPISCRTGDRIVLRDASGHGTLGGGKVTDPFASGKGSRHANAPAIAAAFGQAAPEQVMSALLAIDGHEIDLDHLGQSLGLTADDTGLLCGTCGAIAVPAKTPLAIPKSRYDHARAAILDALAAFHREQGEAAGILPRDLKAKAGAPLSSALFQALIADLAGQRLLERAGALLRLPGHVPSIGEADLALWQQARLWLEERGPKPFTSAELVREVRTSEAAAGAMIYRRLQTRDLWRITDKRLMLREHVEWLAARVARLDVDGQGFTAAQFRDFTGIGRNFTIELLEFFDAIGVTARRGDLRRLHRDFSA